MLRLSFSQLKLFETCPKHYYFRYVQKLKEQNVETKWMHFGSAMHAVLEKCYSKKEWNNPAWCLNFAQQEWDKYKLDGRMDYELFKKCCIQGLQERLDVREVEEKVFLDVGPYKFVGYLDIVTNDDVIIDWKSGTYSAKKANDYLKQLKCYSYLFWRKHGRFPKKTQLYFPKNNKYVDGIFTEVEILSVEQWIIETGDKIQMMIDTNASFQRNQSACFFCGYKLPCATEHNKELSYTIVIENGQAFIEGDITELLSKGIDKALSYDLKDKYWIQQQTLKKLGGLKSGRYDDIGTKHLYMKRYQMFGIGHIELVKKTLQDYGAYVKSTIKIVVDDRRPPITPFTDFTSALITDKTLRYYQTDAISALAKTGGSGFIELATGLGKTMMTAEIIRMAKTKTLWIVDKKHLLKQTHDEFEELLGLPMGIIGAGKADNLDSPVILATVQSLSRGLVKYKELLNSINMVIVDEAHHASADTYVKVFRELKNAKYRIGTTGTVKRDDGNEMIFESLIGPVVYRMSADKGIEEGYLVKPHITFIKQPYADVEGTYPEVYDEMVVHNHERNAKIKELSEYCEKKKLLVLVNRIEHGQILAKQIGADFIHGSLPTKERDKLFKKFETSSQGILVGMLPIFSEGVNVPDIDIIINACANKGEVKTIQTLGRALRTSAGKDGATYIDFVDECLYLKEASKARMKTFKEQGYSVELI
jgi:superfamily II DNA or RNA helicase